MSRYVFDNIDSLQKLVQKCNSTMRKIDRAAYAFLEWIPYDLSDLSRVSNEAAFIGEVIAAYQLIGECGKYIWYNDYFAPNFKNNYYEYYLNLKNMRIFYCHPYKNENPQCLEALYNYCGIFNYIPDINIIEDNINSTCTIKINVPNKCWTFAREKLYNDTQNFLCDYCTYLEEIMKKVPTHKENFKKQLIKALSLYYSVYDRQYVEYIFKDYLRLYVDAGAWKSDYIAVAKMLLDDKCKIAGCVDIILKHARTIDFFKNNSNSFVPFNIFNNIIEKKYDKKSGRIVD